MSDRYIPFIVIGIAVFFFAANVFGLLWRTGHIHF